MKEGTDFPVAMLQLLLSALVYAEYLKNVNCSPIKGADTVKEDGLTRAVHNPETLDGLLNTQYAFTEGDIVMFSDRNAVEHKWPEVKGQTSLSYVISRELASRTADILSAMAMVQRHTCVTFHNRTTESDYLFFKLSQGCASYVGFVGGEQAVFVGPTCNVGNICHELLHALGFHHEHTRTDRDKYVSIISNNIMKGAEKNFQEQNGNTFALPYDIHSILHYGSSFFSETGQPTIVAKTNEGGMGQRTHMTKVDIQRVRHLYNCGAEETVTDDWTPNDGIRRTGVSNQDDATGRTTVEGHLSSTVDSSQNGTLSPFQQVSGPAATNSTSGFNQGPVSAGPQLEEVIASASPSPVMPQSMATTRGRNDTSIVKAAAQS